MKAKIYLLTALLSITVLVTGCHVLLIGAYDQVTDQGIQKVQTDVTELFITLKKNLINNDAAANSYPNFIKTYNDIEAEVESISIRSKALPKYAIITSQIDLLNQNINELEALHKLGSFNKLSDIPAINTDMSSFEALFKGMITLQNGLKREKITK